MTFKLHPLHTIDRHADVIRSQGILGYHAWLAEKRCTGRSTALALQFIAAAILHPHIPVMLADHTHSSSTVEGKRAFAQRVLAFAEELGLVHLWTQLRNGDYYLIFGDDSK